MKWNCPVLNSDVDLILVDKNVWGLNVNLYLFIEIYTFSSSSGDYVGFALTLCWAFIYWGYNYLEFL